MHQSVCLHFTFSPWKDSSFRRNCCAPAHYAWPGHPNSEHSKYFPLAVCMKAVVNSLSETYFFIFILQGDSCCFLMSWWNVITLNETVIPALILLVHAIVPICFGRWKKKKLSHASGMDWMFVFLQNSYTETLIPNVTVFGVGAFGR